MGRCVHEADQKWGGESKGADEKWGGESVTPAYNIEINFYVFEMPETSMTSGRGCRDPSYLRRDEVPSSGLASLRTSKLFLRVARVRRNEAPLPDESVCSRRGHWRTAHV